MRTTHRFTAMRFAASTVVLLAAALPWQAALAEHAISAAAGVCELDRYQQVNCTGDQVNGQGGTVSFQTSLPGQQASASQGYGVFRGSADASVQNGGSGPYGSGYNIRSNATGYSTDTWVIGGGTGSGFLQFTWSIDGTTFTSGSGQGYFSDARLTIDASILARLPGSIYNVATYSTTGAITQSGTYQMSEPATFYFGAPIDITFSSIVLAQTGVNSQYTGGSSSYNGSAHADFGHTAILTAVQAYDTNGNLIPNIIISAESGTQYPLSAVPEPSHAALMLLGTGALVWRMRRRRAGAGRRPLI